MAKEYQKTQNPYTEQGVFATYSSMPKLISDIGVGFSAYPIAKNHHAINLSIAFYHWLSFSCTIDGLYADYEL